MANATDKYNKQISDLQDNANAQQLIIDGIISQAPGYAAIKNSITDWNLAGKWNMSGPTSIPLFRDPTNGGVLLGNQAVIAATKWQGIYDKDTADMTAAQKVIDNYKAQIDAVQKQADADPIVKAELQTASAATLAQQKINYAQANTRYYIYGGIALVLVVVGAILYWKFKK
jgi:hypothetical protein